MIDLFYTEKIENDLHTMWPGSPTSPGGPWGPEWPFKGGLNHIWTNGTNIHRLLDWGGVADLQVSRLVQVVLLLQLLPTTNTTKINIRRWLQHTMWWYSISKLSPWENQLVVHLPPFLIRKTTNITCSICPSIHWAIRINQKQVVSTSQGNIETKTTNVPS